jgi:hypothetical protein
MLDTNATTLPDPPEPHIPPREVYGLLKAGSPAVPALLAAISVDDADRVRELLSLHPGLISERLTPQSSLPLTLAAKDCSTRALRALLESGADVSADHNLALFLLARASVPRRRGS